MTLEFVVDISNAFRRDGIERVMTNSLVADTRTNRHLHVRYHRTAALHGNRQIRGVLASIEADRLANLEAVCVFENESELLLFAGAEIHFNVTVSVDAFHSIR